MKNKNLVRRSMEEWATHSHSFTFQPYQTGVAATTNERKKMPNEIFSKAKAYHIIWKKTMWLLYQQQTAAAAATTTTTATTALSTKAITMLGASNVREKKGQLFCSGYLFYKYNPLAKIKPVVVVAPVRKGSQLLYFGKFPLVSVYLNGRLLLFQPVFFCCCCSVQEEKKMKKRRE